MPEDFVDSSRNEPDAFEQALAASEAAAARRQKQFWVLGLLWVTAVFAAVYYFNVQITKVQRDYTALEEKVSKAMTIALDGLADARAEVFALRGAQERKASPGNQVMDEFSYALKLAQAEVEFQPLTRTERDSLRTARQKAEKQETASALYLQGSALVRDKPSEAIKLLESAVEKDPGYVPALVALGSSYRNNGNYPQAEETLRKAIELKSTRTFTRSELCYVLRIRGTADKDPACRPAKDQSSSDWQTYHDSAFGNYQQKVYDEAERDWRKAAELSPTPAGSLENLGLIYLSKGEWQKAIDNAKTVTLIDPKSSWNWLFLYIAADRLGQKDLVAESSAKWKGLREPGDIDDLKPLLPDAMQSYITR